MHIVKPGKPLQEDDLTAFEQMLQHSLPQPYRDFLKTNNGGYPEPTAFGFADGSGGSLMTAFYGLKGRPHIEMLSYWLRNYQGRIPADLLAIGGDAGGNQICLGLVGENRGKVFFWDHHDEVEEGETPDDRNVTLVAESFDAFLNGLYEYELP